MISFCPSTCPAMAPAMAFGFAFVSAGAGASWASVLSAGAQASYKAAVGVWSAQYAAFQASVYTPIAGGGYAWGGSQLQSVLSWLAAHPVPTPP